MKINVSVTSYCRALLVIAAVLAGSAVALASMSDIETAIMNKDYESARALSVKMLHTTSDPHERGLAQYYLGLSQLRLGKLGESRKAFHMTIESHPDNDIEDKAVVGLIEGLHLGGFYKDALKECDRYLKRKPKSAYLSAIYYKMARANMKLMNWQEANNLLEKVVKDFPQSMEAPLARQMMDEKQYFAVQVGSFEDKNRAVDLVNDLKNTQYYAYLVETNTQDKKLYRVRVGQLTSLEKAKELERHLSKLGYATLIYP